MRLQFGHVAAVQLFLLLVLLKTAACSGNEISDFERELRQRCSEIHAVLVSDVSLNGSPLFEMLYVAASATNLQNHPDWVPHVAVPIIRATIQHPMRPAAPAPNARAGLFYSAVAPAEVNEEPPENFGLVTRFSTDPVVRDSVVALAALCQMRGLHASVDHVRTALLVGGVAPEWSAELASFVHSRQHVYLDVYLDWAGAYIVALYVWTELILLNRGETAIAAERRSAFESMAVAFLAERVLCRANTLRRSWSYSVARLALQTDPGRGTQLRYVRYRIHALEHAPNGALDADVFFEWENLRAVFNRAIGGPNADEEGRATRADRLRASFLCALRHSTLPVLDSISVFARVWEYYRELQLVDGGRLQAIAWSLLYPTCRLAREAWVQALASARGSPNVSTMLAYIARRELLEVHWRDGASIASRRSCAPPVVHVSALCASLLRGDAQGAQAVALACVWAGSRPYMDDEQAAVLTTVTIVNAGSMHDVFAIAALYSAAGVEMPNSAAASILIARTELGVADRRRMLVLLSLLSPPYRANANDHPLAVSRRTAVALRESLLAAMRAVSTADDAIIVAAVDMAIRFLCVHRPLTVRGTRRASPAVALLVNPDVPDERADREVEVRAAIAPRIAINLQGSAVVQTSLHTIATIDSDSEPEEAESDTEGRWEGSDIPDMIIVYSPAAIVRTIERIVAAADLFPNFGVTEAVRVEEELATDLARDILATTSDAYYIDIASALRTMHLHDAILSARANSLSLVISAEELTQCLLDYIRASNTQPNTVG